MKVGIIGYGFVGQAVHVILKDCDVTIFDTMKEKYQENVEKIYNTDIVFVCVPTPEGNEYSVAVKNTLENLKFAQYRGLVVVKSTIMHDILEKYEQELNLCFNPEFLNQNTFIDDSFKQKNIILGGEIDVTDKVGEFYHTHTKLGRDVNVDFCTLKEACDFKYTRNLYGAYKVLFWEFIQDTTGNARKMAELYSKMEYQSEMSQVGMDGFRGYGGACFPKDVNTWNNKHKHELTEFMKKYNEKL